MPYQGSLTLGDVAARTATLAVACSRCERTGRYPLTTLIDRYGMDYTIPTLSRVCQPGARSVRQSPPAISAMFTVPSFRSCSCSRARPISI